MKYTFLPHFSLMCSIWSRRDTLSNHVGTGGGASAAVRSQAEPGNEILSAGDWRAVRLLLLTLIAIVCCQVGSGLAQDSVAKPSAPVAIEELRKPDLVVSPAAEPTPALRYRLWLPTHQLRPGMAQLHFSRALITWQQFPSESRNKWEEWTLDEATPPNSDELKAELIKADPVFAELHDLALCEDSRWDHRLRELRGPSLYAYRFPDVQESRGLARLLMLKLDFQIREGDVEGAIETLQDGFRLASFVAQGETLVQQLVGLAMSFSMLNKLEQLIQVHDSPNLYWALATLPRPLVDSAKSVQFELGIVHRVLPILSIAETEERDPAYWDGAWATLVKDLQELGAKDVEEQLRTVVSDSAKNVKERLVASGLSEKEVESMHPTKAVMMDASIELRRVADELTKSTMLPGVAGHVMSQRESEQFDKWLDENKKGSAAAAIASLLFPGVHATRNAASRHEYVVNRLMTIEAIRMFVATKEGKLPGSLDELEALPAMPNPFTGQNFDYKIDGQNGDPIAILTGEGPASIDSMKELRVQVNP